MQLSDKTVLLTDATGGLDPAFASAQANRLCLCAAKTVRQIAARQTEKR